MQSRLDCAGCGGLSFSRLEDGRGKCEAEGLPGQGVAVSAYRRQVNSASGQATLHGRALAHELACGHGDDVVGPNRFVVGFIVLIDRAAFDPDLKVADPPAAKAEESAQEDERRLPGRFGTGRLTTSQQHEKSHRRVAPSLSEGRGRCLRRTPTHWVRGKRSKKKKAVKNREREMIIHASQPMHVQLNTQPTSREGEGSHLLQSI